jgi:hypothetical protein
MLGADDYFYDDPMENKFQENSEKQYKFPKNEKDLDYDRLIENRYYRKNERDWGYLRVVESPYFTNYSKPYIKRYTSNPNLCDYSTPRKISTMTSMYRSNSCYDLIQR